MRLEDNFFLFPMSAGKINYIGDLYFDISPANNYIIFSTHGSSFKVEDNFEETQKMAELRYQNIGEKFQYKKSIVGPITCDVED